MSFHGNTNWLICSPVPLNMSLLKSHKINSYHKLAPANMSISHCPMPRFAESLSVDIKLNDVNLHQ